MVHVKNAMPRELVLDVRRRFFELVEPSGVLRPDTAAVDGVFSGGKPEGFMWPKIGGLKNTAPIEELAKGKEYAALAAPMHEQEWTNQFAGNPCMCSHCPHISEAVTVQ